MKKLEVNNQLLKIIAIICFLSIFLSSIIAHSSPIVTYELSIYDSTPLIVWLALIFSASGGIFILIHQAYTKGYEHSDFWIIGAIILILFRISLICIPFIRGYFSWREDHLSHFGYIKDILLTGHLSTTNFYPVTHTFLSELVLVSGLNIKIANYSTALLSVLYIISIYLIATTVFSSKRAHILSFAAIGGVLFNSYDVFLMPNGWSILYLPLLLYIHFKNLLVKSISYKLLLVLLLVIYPFFHPLSTILVIVVLLTSGISSILIEILSQKKFNLFSIISDIRVIPILIEITIFILWISSFNDFRYITIRIYESIMQQVNENALGGMKDTLEKIDISGLDLFTLIIKMMGDDLIFYLLTLISLLILYRKSNIIKLNKTFLQIVCIIISIVFLYLLYLLDIIPGLGNISSGRLLSYSIILTPLPAAFVFNYMFEQNIKIAPHICFIIIMTASVLSIFAVYPSPYILNPTPEVTQMDIHSANWLIGYKNRELSCIDIMSPEYRFSDYILGCSLSRNEFNKYVEKAPNHFNYTIHQYLGTSYLKNQYLLITRFDAVIYQTVWKVVGRFNQEDFLKLNEDQTVNKLYSNGEANIYLVMTYPR